MNNVNVKAFTEATAIIGGRDAVEEFLTCGIWPLSDGWEIEVETRELPLSKVVIPMPMVTPVIRAQETGAAFEARIASTANQLIGNYTTTEHASSATLQHGRPSHVFELTGVSYKPRPEPVARMMKRLRSTATTVPAPLPTKIVERKKWKRALSHSGDQTSAQERALSKPLKPIKKLGAHHSGAQSSRPSIHVKTLSRKPLARSLIGAKAASTAGGDIGYPLARAIELFSSSTSDEEPIGDTSKRQS
jgi:hypothetical protein